MFAKSESNKKIDNRTNNDLPLYMWMSCYVLSLINLARKQAFLESATRLCAHRHYSSTSKAAGELFLRSSSKNSVFFLAATRIQKGRKRRKRKLVFSRSLTASRYTEFLVFCQKRSQIMSGVSISTASFSIFSQRSRSFMSTFCLRKNRSESEL